jgi:hypothetical protein
VVRARISGLLLFSSFELLNVAQPRDGKECTTIRARELIWISIEIAWI